MQRLIAIVLLAAICGCESTPLTESARDASAAAVDVGDEVDTSPPACGPSPITIDYQCCSGCSDRLPCRVAAGLAEYPCAFGGGWLVADCSQCLRLP